MYAFTSTTEFAIQNAVSCYISKAHFDMCLELLKLDIISKEVFLRSIRNDINLEFEQ